MTGRLTALPVTIEGNDFRKKAGCVSTWLFWLSCCQGVFSTVSLSRPSPHPHSVSSLNEKIQDRMLGTASSDINWFSPVCARLLVPREVVLVVAKKALLHRAS